MRKKIAFFDVKPYDEEFFTRLNSSYDFTLSFFHERLTEENISLAKGHDGVCVFVNDKLSANVIEQLSSMGIQIIALRCSGYNNVEMQQVKDKLPVVNVPAYSPHAVAEHTLGLILALNRHLHIAYNRTRSNNFSLVGLLGFDLHKKTAGIIGTGQIGQVVVRILHGLGMKVLAYDVAPNQELIKEKICEYVPLETLYKESDVISLHCPLTPDNRHMLNKEAFAQMKDGVMIINTGRGLIIDTPDLIEALKSKKVGSAGLDVYEEESGYFFEDLSQSFIPDDVLARLQTFPNVLITAHQAFFTREALEKITDTTLQNLTEFFSGKPLTNQVQF